jgi:hypothetical protein
LNYQTNPEDKHMRSCIVLVTAAAMLGACSSDAQRMGASAPTVTYSYQNAEQFRDASDKADDYCDELYDADARPLDLWARSGQASFACVPD